MIEREHFPPCRYCGKKAQFTLHAAAVHIGHHEFFNDSDQLPTLTSPDQPSSTVRYPLGYRTPPPTADQGR
jgi:hypothetical protein